MKDYNKEQRIKQIKESSIYLNTVVELENMPQELEEKTWTSWKS